MPRYYQNPKDDILRAMKKYRRQTGQNASVRDLAKMTGQSKSNVQHHITDMWQAGKTRRCGGQSRCWTT